MGYEQWNLDPVFLNSDLGIYGKNSCFPQSVYLDNFDYLTVEFFFHGVQIAACLLDIRYEKLT